jgi:uncharacterized membrane protein YkoI
MKYLIIAVLAGSLSAFADHKVEFNQLPQPVQKTLSATRGTDTVKEIQRKLKDGKTVYEVELERRGLNARLLLSEDGTVVRDSRKEVASDGQFEVTEPGYIPATEYAPLFPRVSSLQISDVPQPVQRTINQHAAGRKIADIDKETWNNRTVYEVEFAQAGRNAQVHIAEDGIVVKDERKSGGVGTGLFGLYLGTQLEDTPVAVQEAIRREGAGRQIADIDKEMRTGAPVYEVEFKQPGKNFELHIAETGIIIRDSRREAAGTPDRQPQTGTGRGDARDLTVQDLPAAVQDQVVRLHGDVGTLKKIQRQTRDGKVSYEIEFEKEGRNAKLQFDEDGTITKDNRR